MGNPSQTSITLDLTKKSFLHQSLLAWYAQHKRPLPWRRGRDPYQIWLSEIILQQTRVVQGLPYYERFIKAYPTVDDLAAASLQEVLHHWQGLGYYTRARNLHKCSRQVVKAHNSIFPTTYKALLQLPGIGTYTAAAIASIAFDECVAVVDGNVYRVLARLFGREDDISSSQGKKAFHYLATTLLPERDIGTYNQAMMEFGALHCMPKQPKCTTCPLQKICVAYQQNAQQLLPVKKRRIKVKDRYMHYVIIYHGNRVYLRERKAKDIWQGLYEFYLIESKTPTKDFFHLVDPLMPYIKAHALPVEYDLLSIKHQLTHQNLFITFSQIDATDDFLAESRVLFAKENMRPYHVSDIEALPFPRAIYRFLTQDTYLAKHKAKLCL